MIALAPTTASVGRTADGANRRQRRWWVRDWSRRRVAPPVPPHSLGAVAARQCDCLQLDAAPVPWRTRVVPGRARGARTARRRLRPRRVDRSRQPGGSSPPAPRVIEAASGRRTVRPSVRRRVESRSCPGLTPALDLPIRRKRTRGGWWCHEHRFAGSGRARVPPHKLAWRRRATQEHAGRGLIPGALVSLGGSVCFSWT